MAVQVDQKVDQPSFRLTYFGGSGRAEPIRLAAAFGGIAFEDNFITKDQQVKDKADGKRRWSGPPEIVLLDKDGNDLITIGQSNACIRYVGTLAGLYPATKPVYAALIDEILDSVNDLISAIAGAIWESDNNKKKAATEVAIKKTLPYWLGKFEKRLEENAQRGAVNGLFVGSSPTIADLKVLCVFTYVNQVVGAADVIKKYARLQAFITGVGQMSQITAFREKFSKNVTDAKDKKVSTFKYSGKNVPASF